VQAVHGTLDGGRADTSDAIFTIRRMASIRPNMESVSVVSVIALRARLDREAPESSVAARVAHRVSVALVQHVAAKCFPALLRLPKLMVGSQRYAIPLCFSGPVWQRIGPFFLGLQWLQLEGSLAARLARIHSRR
jgi:hypothetical protein